MSVTASPVTPSATVVFTGGYADTIPQAATIYTVLGPDPERIETVYMQADFAIRAAATYLFSIQLVDASGVVLYEQVTSPLLTVDGAQLTAFPTWSRLGNDSSQAATYEKLFALDDIRRAWPNMRLPDLVLQPQSSVRLVFWIDDGGEGSDVAVTNIATTVTRNAGAVSDTSSALFPQPYLVPATG